MNKFWFSASSVQGYNAAVHTGPSSLWPQDGRQGELWFSRPQPFPCLTHSRVNGLSQQTQLPPLRGVRFFGTVRSPPVPGAFPSEDQAFNPTYQVERGTAPARLQACCALMWTLGGRAGPNQVASGSCTQRHSYKRGHLKAIVSPVHISHTVYTLAEPQLQAA